MNLKLVGLAAAPLIMVTHPAFAQNSSAEPPVVAAPPPTTTTTTDPAPPRPAPRNEAPPAQSSPPPASVDVDPVPPPSTSVVVTPAPQTVPLEPMTIDPDAAYPEGFADPSDPFSNELSVSYRQQQGGGFPWGLLGLLGLLGLIPLFRNRGDKTVYVQRDEELRRPVRHDPPSGL